MKRLLLLTLVIGGLAQAAQPTPGSEWQRLDANEPAPTFSLTSQDGKRVSLKDFRGKAVVLTFIYTECKDICPVLPQIIGRTDQILSEAERKKVRFVGISIDPRRDTPEKLRSFMQGHNLSAERWTLLTGSLREASKVADDYGIVAKPDLQGDLVHNAVYVLIDPQGRLRTEFHGLFTPTQEIAKALRQLIATPVRKGA
ncbi:MAG: SCO family protein [Rhodocyclales bacterium]|nr:SCO family protein [Rhodocyclales bacterium]